jgi:hypothetical protein
VGGQGDRFYMKIKIAVDFVDAGGHLGCLKVGGNSQANID